MKTKHVHTVKANKVRANHNWSGNVTVVATEIVGDVETEVTIELSGEQLKSLVQKSGRNALIDAKLIRGKKSY